MHKNMKNKKDRVKEILLMPIIASKSIKGISMITECNSNRRMILSGQMYKGAPDEDMSDIAVLFYECIYNLEDKLLKENNGEYDLYCDQFAGDTMNSYNQIVGRKGCPQSDKEKWFNQYHCLANFWLLPMEVGRKGEEWSKSKKAKDYMDNFLYVLANNFGEYKKRYPCYFKNLEKIEDFYDMHGFNDEKCKCVIRTEEEYQIISKMAAADRIKRMQEFVDWRAEYLAEQYTEDLYQLFIKEGLINQETV